MTKRSVWIAVGVVVMAAIVILVRLERAKPIQFREEVKLGDGRVIEIDRSLTMRTFGEIGGPGGAEVTENSFSVVNPERGRKIPVWSSTAGLIPMVLDFDVEKNTWFVIATFYTCDAWETLGKPKLPYAQFLERGEGWIQVPLDEKLIGTPANVLTGVSNKREIPHHTLDTKRVRDSDPRVADKYRTVVRKWINHC